MEPRTVAGARVGFAGLLAHKLRSLLATLGIVFGVAAVIAMLAVGEGAKREALAKYETWGSENIIVRDTGATSDDRRGEGAFFSEGLTREDARAISELVSTSICVAPQADRTATVSAGDEEAECLVVAATPHLVEVMNLWIDRGRFIHDIDLSNKSKVCVLGADVARKLFPFSSPVGKRVKIDRDWFYVVGKTEGKSKIAESAGVLSARDLNKDVYIPLNTELSRRKARAPDCELSQITLKIVSIDALKRSALAVKRIMERRHHGASDFGLVLPEELIEEQQKEQKMFNVVLGAIAAISLLVGGIGIMNIMLASVLERRREIGIRRALGAKRSDIMTQFLAEAAMISLSGGILGVALGLLLAQSIHLFAQFHAHPTIFAVTLAFGVSVTTGLVFGYYPARRAAGTHPIEALRYE